MNVLKGLELQRVVRDAEEPVDSGLADGFSGHHGPGWIVIVGMNRQVKQSLRIPWNYLSGD